MSIRSLSTLYIMRQAKFLRGIQPRIICMLTVAMLPILKLLYQFNTGVERSAEWGLVSSLSHLLGLQQMDFYLPAKENVSYGQKYDGEDELTQILTDRLSEFSFEKEDLRRLPCPNATEVDKECFEPSCTATFASSPRERLRQILATRRQIPVRYLRAMTSSTLKVTSRNKYVFVTAGSSGHYYEMQGLIRNLRQHLFTHLSNFTFVVYDLGFTAFERYTIQKNCRCTVLDFPYSKLPFFVRHLTCYAWKPIAVAALADKADYLVWIDTSIRWEASTSAAKLERLFRRARERGAQGIVGTGSAAVRTDMSTFHFYGEQDPCLYAPFTEMYAGFILLHVDRFTRDVIIQPWLSCAFDQRCMCVKDFYELYLCANTFPRRYSRCHRFDQSSLNIIYSKLFVDQRPIVYVPNGYVRVEREPEDWFKPQKADVIRLTIGFVLAGGLLVQVWAVSFHWYVHGRESVKLSWLAAGMGMLALVTVVGLLVYLLWLFL